MDPATRPLRAARLGRIGWALYDWANSSFAAVISTFVFPAYFARQVAADVTAGTSQWGYTVGIAGLFVALAAPALGAIADQGGRRKPGLAAFTVLCVLATAALWWAQPGGGWLWVLVLAGLATVGAEFAVVFYNAMLPTLTSYERIGRWSGWAWGLGYAGGLGCLLLALYGFVGPDPWFVLDRDQAQHVRATFVLVAGWYGLFALPLFLFTPDAPPLKRSFGDAAARGLRQLRESLRQVHAYRPLVRFLVAHMLFIDGLATIFAFGGLYAAGTFGMDESGVLAFGIALNVSAGLGAAAFAWVDDRLGSKQTIVVALIALLVVSSLLLSVHALVWFWILGTLLGVFVGPVQAAGRSYLARAAPPDMRGEFFGLFAFSGKATAFVGPLLVAWITAAFDSQRAGLSIVVVFFALGLALMLTVPEPGRRGTR